MIRGCLFCCCFLLWGHSAYAVIRQTTPIVITRLPLTAQDLGDANPQVAVNLTGKTVAVWTKTISTTSGQLERQVQASDTTITAAVTPPTWSEPTFIGLGIQPQIAINNTGKAIAIWVDTSLGLDRGVVKVSHFNGTLFPNGTFWSDEITLSPQGLNYTPQIAIDTAGNAIAVWVLATPPRTTQLYLSEYKNGVWDQAPTPVLIPVTDSDQTQPGRTVPQIEMRENGVAVLIWQTTTAVQAFSVIQTNTVVIE